MERMRLQEMEKKRQQEREEEERRKKIEEERRRREHEEKERMEERERKRLQNEIRKLQERREELEGMKDELMARQKLLTDQRNNFKNNGKNSAKEIWRKKYLNEKKSTSTLDEQNGKLKKELSALNNKIIITASQNMFNNNNNSKNNNFIFNNNKKNDNNVSRNECKENPELTNEEIIDCYKLQHELFETSDKLENTKIKLMAEMKLRLQVEKEIGYMRGEIESKKSKLSHLKKYKSDILHSE
ncbi:hypothetical protein HELRODRAFT_194448 [Helobdella robusta]|uniref:Spermatogenesis-associated protein 1 C-terminal domain-containing protein n=1 Tax=Helobdella robusta TaxID=6412 RepID=T1FW25_HELRO|nr:hypothetical protein HELRODRAFT_194448 [Helobdella robusta]ESN91943.1 hypothetical protein HELRODRAFT_194448 [Helobdella robusta]